MGLVQLMIVLVIVGVVLWLINSTIPIQHTIKIISNVVVILALVLYVLAALGFVGSVFELRLVRV